MRPQNQSFDRTIRSNDPPPIASDLPGQPDASFEIYWSTKRLRRMAWMIAALATISLPLATATTTASRSLALLWMATLLIATRGILRRINTSTPILVIDRQGIIDNRLNSEPIYWSDIDAIAPGNPDHSRVLELYLKWPEYRLAKMRPLTRLGGTLQRRIGLPALTLSLLFLDCEFAAVCDAIATFRPGLLPSQLIHHD